MALICGWKVGAQIERKTKKKEKPGGTEIASAQLPFLIKVITLFHHKSPGCSCKDPVGLSVNANT